MQRKGVSGLPSWKKGDLRSSVQAEEDLPVWRGSEAAQKAQHGNNTVVGRGKTGEEVGG